MTQKQVFVSIPDISFLNLVSPAHMVVCSCLYFCYMFDIGTNIKELDSYSEMDGFLKVYIVCVGLLFQQT